MPLSIKEEYNSAVRQWLEAHYGEVEPAFWEVEFAPEPEIVEQARMVVAGAIHNHRSFDAETAVITLLHLIRSRLSSIRINRLWPEVARVLSGEDFQPTASRCGIFFRDALNNHTGYTIPNIHNRFVAYCLDQTAVGADRTQIVLEYFEFLLRRIIEFDKGQVPAIEAVESCNRFIDQSVEKERVEVYRIQLERNGETLISLIRELRIGDVFHEIGFWDWDSLRLWWKDHSGEDLNRLTPETRKALEGIISRVEGALTYRSLSEFVEKHGHRVLVEFPDRIKREVDSFAGSPLGPIRLKLGAMQRNLQLRDSLGLTGEAIARMSASCWHEHEDRAVFAWQSAPFEILADGQTEPAKPFYVGSTVEKARVKGFYVASNYAEGRLPEIRNASFKNALHTKFSLADDWIIRETGLVFRANAIFSLFIQEPVDAKLVCGDQVVWQGRIEEKYTKLGTGCEFEVSESAELELLDGDGNVLKIFRMRPPDTAFVAIDGLIQKHQCLYVPDWFSTKHFTSGVIVAVAGKAMPDAYGCTLKKMPMKPGLSAWTLYRVTPDGEQTCFRISVPPFKWELDSGNPVSLLQPKDKIELDSGIAVSRVSDCFPYHFSDSVILKLPRFSNGMSPVRGFRLVARLTSGERCRWNVSQICECATKSGHVSLKELFDKSALDFPVGHFEIYCEKPGVGLSESIKIFRIPKQVTPVSCRIDEPQKLQMSIGGQQVLVHSVVCLLQLIAGERSKAEGWYATNSGAMVRFEWPAQVVDCLLRRSGEPFETDRISIAIADQLSLLNPSTDQTICIALGDNQSQLKAGSEVELAGLLASLLEADPEIGVGRVLTAAASGFSRSWIFDLIPSDPAVDVFWEVSASDAVLKVSGRFTGSSSDLQLKVFSGDSIEIASSNVASTKTSCGGLFAREFKESIVFERTVLNLLDCESLGVVELWLEDSQILTSPIPSLVLPEEMRGLREQINSLLKSLGKPAVLDDRKLSQIVTLIERHLRLNQVLPFSNVEAMLSKFEGIGSAVCRRQAISSIRLLKKLAGSETSPILDIDYKDRSPVRLMLVSLAAVYQKRLFRRGLAEPRKTELLENELQNLITESDSENESHWAKSVLEFLVAEAPNPTSNYFEAGDLDTRLVGCDSELNKFFERKCANVDGKRKQDYSSTSSIRGQDNSGCIKE